MIFYKKNEALPYLSFIEENIYGEIKIEWDEKIDSPLSGTTKKKNYRSIINILKYQINGDQILKINNLFSTKIDYWILPENLYVLSINPIKIYFLYHEKEDILGSNRKLGMLINKEFQNLKIERLRILIPFDYETNKYYVKKHIDLKTFEDKKMIHDIKKVKFTCKDL